MFHINLPRPITSCVSLENTYIFSSADCFTDADLKLCSSSHLCYMKHVLIAFITVNLAVTAAYIK